MATKKKKADPEMDELRKKALEPFRPTLTDEQVIEHERKVREESLKNIKKMKDDVSESEKANIKMRACFEKTFEQ